MAARNGVGWNRIKQLQLAELVRNGKWGSSGSVVQHKSILEIYGALNLKRNTIKSSACRSSDAANFQHH